MFRGHQENVFLKYCCAFISKSLHIYFNISLLISLVMLQMNGRLLANVSNKEKEGVFTLTPHTLSISEIFQILLVKTNH